MPHQRKGGEKRRPTTNDRTKTRKETALSLEKSHRIQGEDRSREIGRGKELDKTKRRRQTVFIFVSLSCVALVLVLSLSLSLCPHRLLFLSCLSICLPLFIFGLLIEFCRCLCRVVSSLELLFVFSLPLPLFFLLLEFSLYCLRLCLGRSSLTFAFETIEKGQRATFFVS